MFSIEVPPIFCHYCLLEKYGSFCHIMTSTTPANRLLVYFCSVELCYYTAATAAPVAKLAAAYFSVLKIVSPTRFMLDH